MSSIKINETGLRMINEGSKASLISFGYGRFKEDAAELYDDLTPDNKKDRTATEVGAAVGAISLASRRVRRIVSNQHKLSKEFVTNFFKGLDVARNSSKTAGSVRRVLKYFGEGGSLSFVGKAGKKLLTSKKIVYLLALPVTAMSIFLLGLDVGKKIEKQSKPEWSSFKDVRDTFNDTFSSE